MKKIIDKIVAGGYKTVLGFTIVCLVIATIGAIFFCVNRSYDYLNPLVLVVGTIIYLLGIAKLYKWINKLNEKTKNILVVVLLLFHLSLLLTSALVISSIPQVDLIHIFTEINSLNHTGRILNDAYFSVYPINRFLLIILYSIQKISPEHSHFLFSLFSSVCISTMSLFTYKTVKYVFDDKKALLSLFICVFSPIFYLYVSYYYTDVLMLPFASILIYLIVKDKNQESIKGNVLSGILIGIVALVAYKIRAVSIFLLIAYFIYLFFSKKFFNVLSKVIPMFLAALVTLVCINSFENKFFPNVDADKEFPMTHWIMMGLNEENKGYYSQDDYNLSSSAANVSERTQLNLKEIKNRLTKSGPIGISKLMLKKLLVVWGKGDYSYQKYLGLVKDYNLAYRYLIEDKNIVINYVIQFSKIGILILTIISLVKLLNKKEMSFMAIALFGAVVFYLIWEVCPRYGLSFLPWLIMLGSVSYDNLNLDFTFVKGYNYFKYIILLLSIAIFAIGFNKYTSISLKSNIVAKDTVNKKKYITLNEDNEISQSLKLNSQFNAISLKFKQIVINPSAEYYLELYNEQEKLVFSASFGDADILSDEYTVFYLNEPLKSGQYIIKLRASSGSSLDVYAAFKEEFDYYPNGSLKVNNNIESGDLMFEISYNELRGIYTYIEYGLIVVLSIAIEYVVLFRKKEEINEK